MQTLTCFWGSLMEVRNASELPLQWTTGQKNCEDGWGCQELLMLIENGEKHRSGRTPDSPDPPV